MKQAYHQALASCHSDGTELGRLAGQRQVIADLFTAQHATLGQPLTPQQIAAGELFSGVVVLAEITAKDGRPLFPSVKAVLPVITRLCVGAAKGDPTALRAAERFANFVAAEDIRSQGGAP